ncbi:ankyrin repeat domain-containing protein 17 isoform X2 [Antechinus flavipes]|uniref:ankyrin repeat domain-containing protein 17 isoform X2 n=1 Tax=Antechinus flavipes TaxID=38775 RepID=UPI002235FEB0|nr:ankyrin repeat domain-containing protein 17 isoform X2 [Antechinus flavipes]
MEKATAPAEAEGDGSPPVAAAAAAPPPPGELGGPGGGSSSPAPRGLVRVCDLLLKKKPPPQNPKAKRSRTCHPPSSSDSSSDSDHGPAGPGPGAGGPSSNNSEEDEDDDDDDEDEDEEEEEEEEEEVSEVESFILDQDDLENPMLETASKLLLSGTADGTDLRTVDPETQARLEALLEAAGIGKLSTADGKAFADPEVLRRLTSSVSCALDEAAAALTRMRAESTASAGPTDNRSLAEACSEGDVNAVRKLLIEGRSVNEHTEEGESLLCLACSAGYYELAQVLLAMHANVEDRGIKGDITPLMAAANGGHVKIVKLLLAHGADVNAQSSTGNTALTYACAGGYVDVVKVLLESGASIEDHNENGHTPLMEAGSAGHVEVARLLLENGAGINTHSNEFKESALTLACYKGHLEMVRFLLEAGADQEHKTDEMHTALMEACMDGHVEVARLLLDSGAQVNMPADSFESPLTLAACGGHVELAALLIERGANLEEVNDEGYTPLMEAAREGHEEMVALLLGQGANINAQTEETQETALTLACCGGFLEVADFLIKAGADIELGCSTPLMEAAQEGHLELVKYLLAAGANVHATTATGDTALTYACENGHTDVADVLLQAGADLEHESEGGRTPLMKAARAGHVCTVQFLISKGANVNRTTANNDHTVLSLACAGGHLAVVELLLAHGADPTHRLKDGSTMLIEAAKGGHTSVVCYLLDYPNNLLSAPPPDVTQLTPPSHDLNRAPRVPVQALPMVVPPQEPDKPPATVAATLPIRSKAASKQKSSSHLPANSQDVQGHITNQSPESIVEEAQGKLTELEQRIKEAIEKNAQLQSLELAHADQLTKEKIEELNKTREEQIQKKQKILEELQKVERELQLKTQQQLKKQYLEVKAQRIQLQQQQQQQSCQHLGLLTPVGVGEQLSEGDYARLQPVDPILLKDDPQQSVAQMGFTPIQPLAMPQALPLATGSLPPGSITNLTELQGVIVGQPVLGQAQLAGLGQGILTETQQGLMVASPAQTLNDTLDDIMAAVSGRASAMSNTPTHSISASISQPQTPTPSPIISPSAMLPIYPAIDIDAQTESNHDTALTLACAGGHEELVQTLLERGASIEHRDKKGFTPLILAATAGHVGVVEILLDNGADIEAQSERTKDTPLSLACSGGRQEVVELLLARGANKEHRNVSDYTPLSLAASGGYVNIIKILLNAGAEINSRTGSKLGISPLMLAAMNGHTAAVKLLLDMGSDINAQIETNRNTALTLACFQGRTEVVSLLLDRKANVEHRAKTGLTPLMEAASGGYAEVGRVLLDKGADVNAPPVPSSRDTALTIAADKGHYKFCELLISRGAHIDVRNKKGNTPLWLAANGGHLDVVQLLVQAGADVDAADNRKITPLMAAFRKGHVKVVRYLVKEVNQFPSDSECMRYIATITDKEMLKKCHLCMESIVQAKDRQAAEANKNASILLEELDLEKLREESRRLALAAKREKRKEKRRKKKEEQRRKLEEIEAKNKENFELQAAQEKEKLKVEDEPEVPMEPPSATTTTTIGISATWTTLAGSHGKRNNTMTTTSSKRKNRKNKITPENVQIIFDDQLPISYNQPEKVNGESKSSSTSESGDSDNMRISSCSDESSNSNSSRKSDSQSSTAPPPAQSSKKQPSVLVTFPKEERKAVSAKTSVKLSETISEVSGNSLSTCTKSAPSPLSSPNGKLTVASPKRGQKREDGWKEVVRRSKKVSVPSTVISRVIGRGGCNINAIREFTGAHIDIDKQKDKTGDRIITIRGGTESTRQATQLINALIKDPDKEIDELIPKNRLKSSSVNSKTGSSAPATTAANSSLMGIKMTTVALSSTSQTAPALAVPALSSASAHKTIKNPVSNVRPGFPVSLPIAYPPPQFAHALLAAQTFQQIRPPRLPMTHFGGTFPPAQSTWGPFPVRPLSPARAPNSPKPHAVPRHSSQQHSSGSQVNPAGSFTSATAATTSSSTVTGPGTPAGGSPSSPSVRRQLFVTVVKTSNATTTTVTTTASHSGTAPTNATYPLPTAKEHYPLSSPSSPSPPAQPGGVSRSSPSECVASSPNKGIPSSDQEAGSPPVVEATSSRQPNGTSSVGSSAGHSAPQPPPGAAAPEPRPPLPPPPPPSQVPPPEVRMTAPPLVTTSSAPVVLPPTAPGTYPIPQAQMGSSQPAPKMELPAIRPPPHATAPTHKNAVPLQNSSVAVLSVNHIKRPHSVPSSVQLPSTLSTQSASQNSAHPANKSMAPNFSAPLPFGPFSTLFENSPTSAHAFWGGSVVSSQSTPESMLSGKSSYLPNSDPLHQSDTSKAPGFRPPLQRPAPSPSGIVNIDSPYASVTPSSTHLSNFASNLSGGQMYAPGTPLGGPPTAANFNRQHFSPLSLLTPCSSASNDSPAQSVSSGVRAPSPAPSAVSLGAEKASNVCQDRKVPVPIGTERSARIRQTGTSTPSVIGSNLATPVGHSGIWSFEGIGGNQDKVDWCHSGMGNHMIHRPMSDPGVFSQHQAMERDSTGIVTPSGTFHQHVPAGYMDFPKVGGMPFSVYGNAMIPPVAPIPESAGGPIFNGPHAADPSWNSLIKMVSNSTENNGPQTVWTGTWAPHLNSVHMNQLG